MKHCLIRSRARRRWSAGASWSLATIAAVLALQCPPCAFAAEAQNWQSDWERTLVAAKKEGQVVLYGSADYEHLFAEFHKKYPEIKVTGVLGRGADVAKRMMSERRAEKYLADLYVNGLTTGY